MPASLTAPFSTTPYRRRRPVRCISVCYDTLVVRALSARIWFQLSAEPCTLWSGVPRPSSAFPITPSIYGLSHRASRIAAFNCFALRNVLRRKGERTQNMRERDSANEAIAGEFSMIAFAFGVMQGLSTAALIGIDRVRNRPGLPESSDNSPSVTAPRCEPKLRLASDTSGVNASHLADRFASQISAAIKTRETWLPILCLCRARFAPAISSWPRAGCDVPLQRNAVDRMDSYPR